MRRLALAVLALVLLRADMYPDASNAKLPEAQDNLGISRSVTAYGAKCDGTTDDTAAIQAGINANPLGSLSLPVGTCAVTGLTISTGIRFKGQGAGNSILLLALSATVPAITVTVSTGGIEGDTPTVAIEDMTIKGPVVHGTGGVATAHGIRLKQAAVPKKTRIAINNVVVANVPGDCLNNGSGEFTANGGWVQAYGFSCYQPGQNGISGNSASDWRLTTGEIYDAKLHNFVCGGCGNFVITNYNIYMAEQSNIYLYNTNNMFFYGGESGGAQRDGWFIDNRTGGSVYVTNYTVGGSGRSANLIYSDVTFNGLNTGNMYVNGWKFYDPGAFGVPNEAQHNIHFNAGNTGLIFGANLRFNVGNWLNPRVTNNLSFFATDNPPVAWTPTLIGSTGGTATMSVQVGSISTAQGVAHIQGRIQATSLAGLTGTLRIGGLPVPPVDVAHDVAPCASVATGWTAPANYTSVVPFIWGDFLATGLFMMRNPTNGTGYAETAVSEWNATSTAIGFSCDYKYIVNQ